MPVRFRYTPGGRDHTAGHSDSSQVNGTDREMGRTDRGISCTAPYGLA